MDMSDYSHAAYLIPVSWFHCFIFSLNDTQCQCLKARRKVKDSWQKFVIVVCCMILWEFQTPINVDDRMSGEW